MRLNRADELKMRELAKKHGLTFEDINEIVSSQYEFINKTTKKLDIKEGVDKEEFSKIKTNFNIPSLCKNYVFKIYDPDNNVYKCWKYYTSHSFCIPPFVIALHK